MWPVMTSWDFYGIGVFAWRDHLQSSYTEALGTLVLWVLPIFSSLCKRSYGACENEKRNPKHQASAVQTILVMLTLLTLPLESVLTDVGAACDGGQRDKKQICKSIFRFYFLDI